MKRFLTILCFFGATLPSVFAQKCKPMVSEDKFTKQKYVLYGGKMEGGFFDGNTYLSFYAGTENEKLHAFLMLEKVIEKPTPTTIEKLRAESKVSKGAKLYFVLDGGETIDLVALADGFYKENTLFGYSIVTQVTYSLTPAQLKLLSEHKITNYRLELSGNVSNIEGKISSGKGKDLLAKFVCANTELKYQ